MDPGYGWRFKPDPLLLLEYLREPVRGRARFNGAINEGIDPYSRQPEQLQNVSENGSYYYYSNRPARNRWGKNRQTADGIGYWRTKGKEELKDENGQIVAYMRDLRFYSGTHENSNSTKWVMSEITLAPDAGHDTAVAICMIRRTGGNPRNEIGQASNSDATNRPPPRSEPCMGSSSHADVGDFLMSTAAFLEVDYDLPPEFNRRPS